MANVNVHNVKQTATMPRNEPESTRDANARISHDNFRAKGNAGSGNENVLKFKFWRRCLTLGYWNLCQICGVFYDGTRRNSFFSLYCRQRNTVSVLKVTQM